MKVTTKTSEWLNACLEQGFTRDRALIALEERYGIKYSIFEEYGLVVLNYDQITSKKTEEIVRECRSLVLALPYEDYEIPAFIDEEDRASYHEKFQVVSRSFDRFFNYGENGVEPDVTELTFYDKLDGSLVGIFKHNGEWLYRTRSMIMPTSQVDDVSGMTWNKLIEEAVGWEWFKESAKIWEIKPVTFVLEVVSPYNRIVTAYEKPEAFLLSVRGVTGRYIAETPYLRECYADLFNFSVPSSYKFSNFKDCVDAQQSRRNLEEGVVGYNAEGVPVCKVKNPAYVAAHHLRGEGQLTARRIMDLMNINEIDEYLAVFPQDLHRVQPWMEAKNNLDMDFFRVYDAICVIANQKEFALCATQYPFQSILFNVRKGLTYQEAWSKLSVDSQIELLKKYF